MLTTLYHRVCSLGHTLVACWFWVWSLPPLYWLRSHLFTPYGVVNCHNTMGYRWGWTDRSELMLYSCFRILIDYVEKEAGIPEGPDVGGRDYIGAEQDREIAELYRWAKTGRAKEHEEYNTAMRYLYEEANRLFPPTNRSEGVFGSPEAQQMIRTHPLFKVDLEARDQEMLERLIKVRGALWS